MKAAFRLILGLALLAGCAPILNPPVPGLALRPVAPTLWKLTLRHGGRPLYAGLVLLRPEAGGTEVVLLDATGIKLLAERVTAGGEVVEVKALRPVADRGLPDFLGRAVYRLFLAGEATPERICRPAGLGELCLGRDEQGELVKIRRWGPLVLWRAYYSINNDKVSAARLPGGWFTPEVRLERQPGPG